MNGDHDLVTNQQCCHKHTSLCYVTQDLHPKCDQALHLTLSTCMLLHGNSKLARCACIGFQQDTAKQHQTQDQTHQTSKRSVKEELAVDVCAKTATLGSMSTCLDLWHMVGALFCRPRRLCNWIWLEQARCPQHAFNKLDSIVHGQLLKPVVLALSPQSQIPFTMVHPLILACLHTTSQC